MDLLIIGAVVAVVVVIVVVMMRRKPAVIELADEDEPQALAPPKAQAAASTSAAKSKTAETGRKGPQPVGKIALQKASAKAAPKARVDGKPSASAPGSEKTEPKDSATAADTFRETIEVDDAEPVDLRAKTPPPAPPKKRKRDVKGLRRGLGKVRESGGLFGRLKALFGGKKEIDPDIVEDIEEILLTSDVGVSTTEALVADIRERLDKKELADSEAVWSALRDRANELLAVDGSGPLRNHGQPTVVLMVGVNGTGKTTTIGKLATQFVNDGKSVLLVAGDTFRAAAVAQLEAWGDRVGCDVFAGDDKADPASVVFDAVRRGKEANVDIILVDTAGRLQTKKNLMDELEKVYRTTGKALDGAPHETLLVVDGTTGQNALQQCEQFAETLPLSGIVLTKLDGTAKGGVVLAIAAEHAVPVRYIGVGERAQDLRDFDAEEFVEAMLGHNDEADAAA
jgi:fused signal recognition particle receptor